MRQLKIQDQITTRSEILDRYLQEISRCQMLTPDEEVELAQRIRKGDKDAVQKLVLGNLRFVVSVAKQYQHQGVNLTDLISEGNIGLIRAAQKFDETRGFKFISYAVWWVRQSILQAVAEQSRTVRLPQNQVGLLTKINRTFAELEQKLGRHASAEEVAEKLNITEEKVLETLASSIRVASMDAPVQDGEETTVGDLITNEQATPTDQPLIQQSLSTEVERALNQLGERERAIIKMSFGIGQEEMSLEEIGAEFQLTRERVRQIREKAIRHLKGQKSSLLSAYLGA